MTDGDNPLDPPALFPPLPPPPPLAVKGMVVKRATDEREATRLVIAVKVTVAAVKETDAIVIKGEWALTVLIRGIEVQRTEVPFESKS